MELPKAPPVRYEFHTTVNVIRKDDLNQANIRLGHIGGLMNDPDYFALIVMNRVLGSGFTSRLFRNVRSREGLAYSVFGVYSANYDSVIPNFINVLHRENKLFFFRTLDIF